jgi:hypothetical protein
MSTTWQVPQLTSDRVLQQLLRLSSARTVSSGFHRIIALGSTKYRLNSTTSPAAGPAYQTTSFLLSSASSGRLPSEVCGTIIEGPRVTPCVCSNGRFHCFARRFPFSKVAPDCFVAARTHTPLLWRLILKMPIDAFEAPMKMSSLVTTSRHTSENGSSGWPDAKRMVCALAISSSFAVVRSAHSKSHHV